MKVQGSSPFPPAQGSIPPPPSASTPTRVTPPSSSILSFSTDQKVHALVVGGKILKTFGILGTAASLLFLIVVGPLALLGIIPSLAFGILGMAVSARSTRTQAATPTQAAAPALLSAPAQVSVLVPSSPPASAQAPAPVLSSPPASAQAPAPVLSSPPVPSPVGFDNAGANCWCNALLQGIFSVQSLREVYETVAQHYADYPSGTPDGEKNHGLAMQEALSQYTECMRKQEFVPQEVSQKVRVAWSYFSQKRPDLNSISPDAGRQEDVSEAFCVLMGEYKQIMEGRGAPPHPSLYHQVETRMHYEPKGSPRPPDAAKLALTQRDPQNSKAYVQLDANNSSLTSESGNTTYLVTLNPPQQEGVASSAQLLKGDFWMESKEEELASPQLRLDSPRLRSDGLEQTFKVKGTQRRFHTVPREFLLQVARFAATVDPVTQRYQACKIHTAVDLKPTLTLPAEATVANRPIAYDLDFFIVHAGDSPRSGHYISYKLLNGEWFECNDKRVRKIQDLAEIERILLTSYLHHYKQSPAATA